MPSVEDFIPINDPTIGGFVFSKGVLRTGGKRIYRDVFYLNISFVFTVEH
jgi:hypothetical protein